MYKRYRFHYFLKVFCAVAIILMNISGLSRVFSAMALAEVTADWAFPGAYFMVNKPHETVSCSVGYPATDSSGNHYFLTAGHCFRDEKGNHLQGSDGKGLNVYDRAEHLVGYEYLSTPLNGITYVDVSLVKMYDGAKFITGNFQGTGFSHIPDKIDSDPQPNEMACMVGWMQMKPLCGRILEVDAVESMEGYPWRIHVDRADYCGVPGDSGGAVYNQNGAMGIHISGLKRKKNATPDQPCDSGFIPITNALNSFRVTIPSLTI